MGSRLARWLLGTVVLAAGLWALFFTSVRLKVVAPCEVVAEDPCLVTAPLTGVIEELRVEPGERVRTGGILFVYEGREARQDLEVARQQVAILQAQLDRAMVLALSGEETEGELRILQNRLAQDRARLALAEDTVSRLEVRAPVAGVVQASDPSAWRGRPVVVGERVLLIVDPSRTRIRIWIPQEDNVPGLAANEVDVFLNVEPGVRREGRVLFLANAATPGPGAAPAFVADARWDGEVPSGALGLKGTAVLHGEETTVAYWIFRKPWASLREFLGE